MPEKEAVRRPLIAGNWKMYKDHREAVMLVEELWPRIEDNRQVEVVVCPPFTALEAVSRVIGERGYGIGLGAQDTFYEREGAFTGEVSPVMLKALGVQYVIVGHSERRQVIGEGEELVAKKLRAVLEEGISAILCVGETIEEREAGGTFEKVRGQVASALQGLDPEVLERLVIAYEPIWAIGTGKHAAPGDAEEVTAFIRREVSRLSRGRTANRMRILYGGSVKPENIGPFMEMPNIDGALVGGASLQAESFASIVNYEIS
jgi:triosephosphate isomerase